jgi:dephospho-CoA kinase
MKKIGVTGGIGSGKSIVCRLFSLNGIPVYNADNAAKRIMSTHQPLKDKLTLHFGNIYNEKGELLREVLAEKVFNNPEELQNINNIVHPFVIADYQKWESEQTAPYILRESAILFESGTNKGLDFIVTVTAPVELRIERIIQRDYRSREQIIAIINRQITDEEKSEKSDFVIINDDITPVMPQVWQLHKTFSNGN